MQACRRCMHTLYTKAHLCTSHNVQTQCAAFHPVWKVPKGTLDSSRKVINRGAATPCAFYVYHFTDHIVVLQYCSMSFLLKNV